MAEAIILFVSIGSFWLGLECLDSFNREYGEYPIDGLGTGLTSLFLIFFVIAWANDSHPAWIVIWIILAVVFYALSLKSAWNTTRSVDADRAYTRIGMAAQILLPLGTALMILLFLALISGAVGGGKGKRRRK